MKIRNKVQRIKKIQSITQICHECAIANGAKSDGGCHTCTQDKCPICGDVKLVHSPTDWIWPKEFKIGYIFD